MTERTTVVDRVLKFIGFIIITICILATIFVLVVGFESHNWGGSDFDKWIGNTLLVQVMFEALMVCVAGTFTGCLFIGLAAIIRLLDQIRWQGEMALGNDGKQTEPH